MFSWRGADGRPDPNMAYRAMLMEVCLGNNDRGQAEVIAAQMGGQIVLWEVDPTTVPNDYVVVTFPDGVWVALEGTTNRDQVFFYAYGGIFPAVPTPPSTLWGTRARVNGGFQEALDLIYPAILAAIPPASRRNVRISGYSYGAGVGQVAARRIGLTEPSVNTVEFLGFGSPKSYAGGSNTTGVNYWARIEAQNPTGDPYYLEFISSNVDPVTLLPPNAALITHASIYLGIVAAIFGDKWKHFGTAYALNEQGQFVPSVALDIPLILGKFEIAYIASQFTESVPLHLIYTSYLPRTRQLWNTSPGRDASLAQFDAFALANITTPLPPLERIGPTITPTNMNVGYFETPVGPVTPANINEFSIVSPNLYFESTASFSGSPVMTMFKGTMLFNTADGPFSESVYSTVTTETAQTMVAKMKQLSQYRMKLSVGPDVADCPNPIIPYGIRVEDELIIRDSKLVLAIPQNVTAQGEFYNPGPSWDIRPPLLAQYGECSNLNMDLCTRVKIASGLPQQVAYSALHGIPLTAVVSTNADGTAQFSAAFTRVANFSGEYQTRLYNYLAAMGSMGLGYRYIQGAWNTTQNTPGGYCNPDRWEYDTDAQQVILWWIDTTRAGVAAPLNTNAWLAGLDGAPPNWPSTNSLCRLQVRKWKEFPVLQGRWAAEVVKGKTVDGVVYAWGLRIKRQCRLPKCGITVVPKVSPIGWKVFTPGNVAVTNPMTGSNPTFNQSNLPVAAVRDWCSIQYVEEHKVGKVPYGAEPGRAANRPT